MIATKMKPPTDKHGKEVSVGCIVHLDHNNRNRRVTVLDYAGNGTGIVGCDKGGSFLLPQSRDNIMVLASERTSAYDDAVAYLDAEVHPRCDYEIYSDMRDIVDEMETENAKLRELVQDMWEYIYIGTAQDGQSLHDRTRELGIEITQGHNQQIVGCCDCEYFDTRKCKSQWPFRLDGFCAWGKLKENIGAKQRRK